jgi:hypothetical protein
MGIFDKIIEIGNKAQLVAGSSIANSPEKLGNKSLSQWECEWKYVGSLDGNFSDYSGYVGVYCAKLNGEIVYIGRATEWNNGGFRKRLSDYTRSSESARSHRSGQKMYEHKSKLQISIIITGKDAEASNLAGRLELALIYKYKPEWNVQHST